MMTVSEIEQKLELLGNEIGVRDQRISIMLFSSEGGGKSPIAIVPNGDQLSNEGRAVWAYTPPGAEPAASFDIPYKGIVELPNGMLLAPFSFDITGKQDYNELERIAKQTWGHLYERVTGQGSRPPL
jgi:hypothetical protein